jgi:predicted double-glycine peptidase
MAVKTNVLMSDPNYGYYSGGIKKFKMANDRDWVCHSCGVKAVNLLLKSVRTSLVRTGGIKIAAGKFVEDSDNGKVAINVIKTRNGPLTIAARYKF